MLLGQMYVEDYGALLRVIGYDEEAIRKKLLNSLCTMGFEHVGVMSFLKVDVMKKLHPELFCSGRLARIRWQKLKL